MKKTTFILSLLLVCCLLTCKQSRQRNSTHHLEQMGFQAFEKETPIFDFELESIKGRTISLSSLKGKVVFLNFWATWCPPCRAEMPSMELLYKELKDEGFEILAVNLQEDKKQVQKFVDDFGLTFPVVLDKTGRIGTAYGARSIPITYLIDKSGIIIAGTIGTREWYTPVTISLLREILKR
ncbi:Thiol-disulfide oxidoreductase ResA [subsurface metagenome]